MMDSTALLTLLQLTSPALPVGAYSYSEGLETLVDRGSISAVGDLQLWLIESLAIGAISLEVAILIRAYRAECQGDRDMVMYWNQWLSATRETAELQQQNWQMGRSLLKLLQDLYPRADWSGWSMTADWNLAIVFARAAQLAQIDESTATLGYLHSWASNMVSAGVKLIPLGQTAGQQLLLQLAEPIATCAARARDLPDDRLFCCSWGLALASMAHETQYSRLFRS
ncbi:urease accessory protein UreF [Chamaesiphon sp.]|uniref:urease accessory protein UreF n=1 Tax=Chamaesiphon sp. TaxID=2814140 RepID=UPI003593BBE9